MNSAQKTAAQVCGNPMSNSQDGADDWAPKAKRNCWSSFLSKLTGVKFVSACSFRTCKRPSVLACVVISLLLPTVAMSANGVYMPPPPMGVGGEDSITTGTGTHCRTSMNSNKGYVDLGITGTQGAANDVFSGFAAQRQDNATIYARLVIPLGDTPRKIDCGRFMQLEIERLESEIKMLRYSPD